MDTKKTLVKVVAVLVVLGGIFLLDILTPFGGNVHFYSEWMRCGERPYESKTYLGGHIEFYQKAPIVSVLRGNTTKYYCTPLEAERAGLSADPQRYEFPHLETEEGSY